jgi:hypothetical protein
LAALSAAIVYAEGDLRAFCLGAWFPALLVAVTATTLFVIVAFDGQQNGLEGIIQRLSRYAGGMRFALLTGWPLAAAAGSLSVATYRYLNRDRSGN